MFRLRYSADVRQHALSLVFDSRLPLTHIAREVGCTVGTLQGWLKKHRQQNTPPNETATFVPVTLVDSANPSAEVVLPNGLMIRLTDASPRSIAELVHALAPSC